MPKNTKAKTEICIVLGEYGEGDVTFMRGSIPLTYDVASSTWKMSVTWGLAVPKQSLSGS